MTEPAYRDKTEQDRCELYAEIERLTRERDEARAEVERLTKQYEMAERFGWRPDAMGLALKHAEAEVERLRAVEAAAKWYDNHPRDVMILFGQHRGFEMLHNIVAGKGPGKEEE